MSLDDVWEIPELPDGRRAVHLTREEFNELFSTQSFSANEVPRPEQVDSLYGMPVRVTVEDPDRVFSNFLIYAHTQRRAEIWAQRLGLLERDSWRPLWDLDWLMGRRHCLIWVVPGVDYKDIENWTDKHTFVFLQELAPEYHSAPYGKRPPRSSSPSVPGSPLSLAWV